MAKRNQGRFVVDVSALDFDDKELKQLEDSINKTVVSALSSRRPKWDRSFKIWDLGRFRPGTLGIWIGDIDDDGIPDNMDLDRFGG